MAVGSILVVGVAVLGSLTVLPAVLAKLGDRLHRSRLPLLRRMKREERDSRVWGFVLGHVLRRPVVALVAGVGMLAALADPGASACTPRSPAWRTSRALRSPCMKTYDRIQAAFPGQRAGADIVVQADDVNLPGRAGTRSPRSSARPSPAGGALPPFDTPDQRRQAACSSWRVPIVGDGTDSTSQAAVQQLRASSSRPRSARPAAITVDVGGEAAQTVDANDNLSSHAPLVFGFVLTMAFLLLLVTFRSIVVPIKAIMLNLLSVAAAFGVLTLVFQHGLGEVIGLPHTTGIVSWLPVFLFVILFGLSMDYHVFILSRIKEGWDKGLDNTTAVEQGIRSSAGVVTAAAAVMVAVFAIFATLSLVDLQEFGIGLAAAVLIDATLIRGIVLPASMKLLGRWNWYMPSKLNWLPSLSEPTARGRPCLNRPPSIQLDPTARLGGPSAVGGPPPTATAWGHPYTAGADVADGPRARHRRRRQVSVRVDPPARGNMQACASCSSTITAPSATRRACCSRRRPARSSPRPIPERARWRSWPPPAPTWCWSTSTCRASTGSRRRHCSPPGRGIRRSC